MRKDYPEDNPLLVRKPTTADGTMRTLILGFALLVLSACGGAPPTTAELESEAFDDLRNEVRQTIEDNDRQAIIVDVVDQLQREFTDLRMLAEERRRRLWALNSNYDATRAEFDDLLEEFARQREASHKEFQEVRAILQKSVTAEEWENLERTNTKAMASLAKLIAAI